VAVDDGGIEQFGVVANYLMSLAIAYLLDVHSLDSLSKDVG